MAPIWIWEGRAAFQLGRPKRGSVMVFNEYHMFR